VTTSSTTPAPKPPRPEVRPDRAELTVRQARTGSPGRARQIIRCPRARSRDQPGLQARAGPGAADRCNLQDGPGGSSAGLGRPQASPHRDPEGGVSTGYRAAGRPTVERNAMGGGAHIDTGGRGWRRTQTPTNCAAKNGSTGSVTTTRTKSTSTITGARTIAAPMPTATFQPSSPEGDRDIRTPHELEAGPERVPSRSVAEVAEPLTPAESSAPHGGGAGGHRGTTSRGPRSAGRSR